MKIRYARFRGSAPEAHVLDALSRDRRPVGVETDSLNAARRQPIEQLLARHHYRQRRFVHNEVDSVERQRHVDGDVGRPGFQNAQQGNDQIEAPIEQDSDPCVRTHAALDQMARQLVRSAVQVAIAESAAFSTSAIASGVRSTCRSNHS